MYTSNSDHLKGFIFCGTLHTKWHCFSSVTLLAEETLNTQNYWFSCFTNAFKALNLTFSNQGQPFYICQWSHAVSEYFTPADYVFSCLLWMMKTRDWTESRKKNVINSIRYLELVFKDFFTMLNLQICEHSICFYFDLLWFILSEFCRF